MNRSEFLKSIGMGFLAPLAAVLPKGKAEPIDDHERRIAEYIASHLVAGPEGWPYFRRPTREQAIIGLAKTAYPPGIDLPSDRVRELSESNHPGGIVCGRAGRAIKKGEPLRVVETIMCDSNGNAIGGTQTFVI